MENPIFGALSALGRIEWGRFPKWPPEFPSKAPVIVARFDSRKKEFTDKIKYVVDSFKGNVPWRVLLPKPPGRNFVIAPARLLEPLPGDESLSTWDLQNKLMTTQPSFGENANRDVPDLADHIRALREVNTSR